jgi:N-acetylneuraminic acid mutarotase
MNKYNLLILTLFTVSSVVAQNGWQRQNDFPDTVSGGIGFSINGKGYYGIGYNPATDRSFWEYDPDINWWIKKKDFPGSVFSYCVGFSINGIGYYGAGGLFPVISKEFWKYEPAKNNWTRLNDFSGTNRNDAVGFSSGSKGYICMGTDTFRNFLKDFWEYDPANDSWTQLKDFPGPPRRLSLGFFVNGKAYVGFGLDSSLKSLNDLWAYDFSNNSWSKMNTPPFRARYDASVFTINNMAYIGLGGKDTGYLNDFWKYDPILDKWTKLKTPNFSGRRGAFSFEINGKGYFGIGGEVSYLGYYDVWSYDPNLNTDIQFVLDDKLIVYPNPGSKYSNIHINKEFIHAKAILYNGLGKEVMYISDFSGSELDFSQLNLVDGCYNLIIIDLKGNRYGQTISIISD